jgi:hypothetical protein
MSEHKLLFSLIVIASFVSVGWVLIIYVLSFHAARRLVDAIDAGYVPLLARPVGRHLPPLLKPRRHAARQKTFATTFSVQSDGRVHG